MKRASGSGDARSGSASLAARNERTLAGAVLLFAAVHVAAAVFFPESAWGAHHLRFTGLPVRILWGVLLLLLLVPRARRSMGKGVCRAAGFWGRGGILPAATAVLLSLAAIALFRSRNLFLGDGYLLSGILASGEKYEPGHAGYGTFLLVRGLSHALRAAGYEAGGVVPFAILSACSGLLLLFAAGGAARELAADLVSRFAATSAVLLSGAALLFFGYVELYSPMQAFVLLYLYAGLRFLGGRSGILFPSAALAAAAALHLSAVALLPSWVFLVLSGERMKSGARTALLAGLAAVSVPIAWYMVSAVSMHGGGRTRSRSRGGLGASVPSSLRITSASCAMCCSSGSAARCFSSCRAGKAPRRGGASPASSAPLRPRLSASPSSWTRSSGAGTGTFSRSWCFL
jgi:hypothetical protein